MGDGKLSTGDHLFLAFLKNGPRSSYDLKKEMSSSINFFWYAQHSQVYQQANRLRRDGFVEPRGDASKRNRQLLALTAKGSDAVDDWLGSPAASYRVYDESLAKIYFSSLTDPDVTRELLLDQQRRHADQLAEFEQLETVLRGVDFGRVVPGQLYALRLGIEVERTYMGWIDQCLADLRDRHGGPS
ncbi:MAG TPA: PadR family transcriptional regulator [Acidimicrobiales bacterium]|jgi:DNA-binding PadR family transcriptional regulator|nr:PadR family transcriptional regulator [Acidimicrobiales bacterium]